MDEKRIETLLTVDLALSEVLLQWTMLRESLEIDSIEAEQVLNLIRMAFCTGEVNMWKKCADVMGIPHDSLE